MLTKVALGVAGIAVVGIGLYYLAKEDEHEEVKNEIAKLGKILGGVSQEEMLGYIDHQQLCEIFRIVKKEQDKLMAVVYKDEETTHA